MKYKKKKESLKDWCKKWPIKNLISHTVSLGMMYMKDRISTEDLQKEKRILVNEVKRRIKDAK